jgi:hypothetical protein
MAGMPALQEQLPAAMDGRYAGTAGAIAGDAQSLFAFVTNRRIFLSIASCAKPDLQADD